MRSDRLTIGFVVTKGRTPGQVFRHRIMGANPPAGARYRATNQPERERQIGVHGSRRVPGRF